MIFVTKEIKTQLENAKKIADIVNDESRSTYSKALGLYQIWYYSKDKTAKNIFEMLRGSSALKEGWYKDREENQKKYEKGVHISFKESYLEFCKIMKVDFEITPSLEEITQSKRPFWR